MAVDLNLVQERLAKWQKKNFPEIPLPPKEVRLLQLALGMCEEAGEVAYEVLKSSQRIRNGAGEDKTKEEIVDGVIDTFIYGMQILSALGVEVEDPLIQVVESILKRDWISFPKDGVGENGYPNLDLSNHKEPIEWP